VRLPRVVLGASFLALALIAEVAALGPAVPGVAARLTLSVATVGMVVPAHNVGALAGILWWGRAQGRVPTSRLLLVGAGLLLAGSLLVVANPGSTSSLVPSDTARPAAFGLLLLATLLLGLGFGLLDAGVNTVLAHAGVGAGLLNALHGTYGLAAIGLPLLVGLADLRLAFVVVAAGCLGLFAPLRRAPRLRRPPRDGGAAGARSRPWGVMLAVAMGVEAGTGAWAAAHLVGLGRSEAAAGTAVAGFFAAFTLARFALAPFADRIESARVVRGGLVLAGLAALFVAVGPWPVVGWLVVGVGIGPVFPTTLSWLVRAHADDHAATRLMVAGSVGAIVLPALVGAAVAWRGTDAVPGSIALIALGAWALARRLPGLPSVRSSTTGGQRT
jgi:fucose permease